jgi:hypothetical protein
VAVPVGDADVDVDQLDAGAERRCLLARAAWRRLLRRHTAAGRPQRDDDERERPDYDVLTVDEVARIAAIGDPVLRNLEITYGYWRLSTTVAQRTGESCNWCTFGIWASRQAGATIRGEDLLDRLRRRLNRPAEVQHPIRSVWRALLRRGLFRPDTRLGAAVRRIHTPFDAFERTSEAVARGNLRVFSEIGSQFARWLALVGPDEPVDSPAFAGFLSGLPPGDPPDGFDYLRRAFTRLQQQRFEPDPARRAELIALANVEIGVHEQTRVQPEIQAARDAPLATARDIKARVVEVLVPGATVWRTLIGRGPVGALLGTAIAAVRRHAARVSREVITESLMVLTLPDETVLALGGQLMIPVPATLQEPTSEEFRALRARFADRVPRVLDWASFEQRMQFILHLFCALHSRADLFSPAFPEAQVRQLLAGRIPDGRL